MTLFIGIVLVCIILVAVVSAPFVLYMRNEAQWQRVGYVMVSATVLNTDEWTSPNWGMGDTSMAMLFPMHHYQVILKLDQGSTITQEGEWAYGLEIGDRVEVMIITEQHAKTGEQRVRYDVHP
jgi:hypothetical protein